VTFTSADYPKSLFEIPDLPPFLYVRGALRCHETAVAVISGMARGVDTAAHKGALAADGRTIGVLAAVSTESIPPRIGNCSRRWPREAA
jgi:DNA processing protein